MAAILFLITVVVLFNEGLSAEMTIDTNFFNYRTIVKRSVNMTDRTVNMTEGEIILLNLNNRTLNKFESNRTAFEIGRLIDTVEDTTVYENYTEEPCVGDPEFCNMTREEYIEMLNDYIFPQPYEWVLIGTHAIVFVIGLIGNALVCIAVYRNHSMRTVTNYFIVNLAVADFMVILICLPPTVLWDVTETWFFGTAMCRIVLYFQVGIAVICLTKHCAV